jgi:hypothetical protein
MTQIMEIPGDMIEHERFMREAIDMVNSFHSTLPILDLSNDLVVGRTRIEER